MEKAYQKREEELYQELNTSTNGITNLEAKNRIKKYGYNELIDKNRKTKLQIFLSQFKSMMIILLLVVGFLSLLYSIMTDEDFLEPIVILGTTLVALLLQLIFIILISKFLNWEISDFISWVSTAFSA